MPDAESSPLQGLDDAPDEDSYRAALDALAARTAVRAEDAARALSAPPFDEAAWRRIFWRTVEVIDTRRRAGALPAEDAVLRIGAVNDALARFAADRRTGGGWPDGFGTDLAREHRTLLARAVETPAGESPSGSDPDLRPSRAPWRRAEPANRVHDAIRDAAPAVSEATDADVAEIATRLGMGRREHAGALRLIDTAVADGLLTDDERDTIARALGRFRKETGGWDRAATPAARLAVTAILGELHAAYATPRADEP